MRKALSFIFFLLIYQGLIAQRVNDRSLQRLDPYFGIAFGHTDYYSVTSFLLSPYANYSEAFLTGDYRREDRAFLPQYGDGYMGGAFNAASMIRTDKFSAVQGKVEYSKGVKKNVKWNETTDFLLLQPYVLADSLGGDMQSEKYEFSGAYSRRFGKLIAGAELGYRAVHEFRKIDPRPRNIASDFGLRGGVSYILGRYYLSATASYRKYHQLQNVEFYNPIGANAVEYHFTGLGSRYQRFDGTNNFTTVRYKGNGYGVAMLLSPTDKGNLFAGVNGKMLKIASHLPGQNEVPVTELSIKQADCFFALPFNMASFNSAISFKFLYERRDGCENVIDNAVEGSYNVVKSLQLYVSHSADASLYALMEKNGLYIKPNVGFNYYRASYVYPMRLASFAALRFGVSGGWLKNFGNWMTSLGLEGRYEANLMQDLELPERYTEKVILHAYTQMFDGFCRNRFLLGVSARVQTEINDNNALFLATSFSQWFFPSDKALLAKLSIGITF